MDGPEVVTRDEFWRLQSAVDALTASQTQHNERIMRLEKKTDDGRSSKGLWGSSSPFPSAVNSSQSGKQLSQHLCCVQLTSV